MRYIEKAVLQFLKEKMCFLGGPRQAGKTTFSLALISPHAKEDHPHYFNWDSPKAQKKLKNEELPSSSCLIIVDEIHKYKNWRNLIKGLYDTNKSRLNFLVTGSSRLDYFRKGGDSLMGRYYYLRLHPFSLLEYNPNPKPADITRLLNFSGFPEPLFKADPNHHRLWQTQRISRVIREDLRDLEKVKDISLIETLAELLPSKVGSPLSIKSLREDLEVDHKTVERWISIFENLYFCFRIAPFGNKKTRTVKKEKKLYLWDWSMVESPGARFENLVASQLLKYCHYLEDTEGHKMELCYVRDVFKREIDFVVTKNKKAIFAVECKKGEGAISEAIKYFKERLPIPHFYQVHLGNKDYQSGNIRVLSFIDFCKELKMP